MTRFVKQTDCLFLIPYKIGPLLNRYEYKLNLLDGLVLISQYSFFMIGDVYSHHHTHPYPLSYPPNLPPPHTQFGPSNIKGKIILLYFCIAFQNSTLRYEFLAAKLIRQRQKFISIPST
jgi:hypothetical protein